MDINNPFDKALAARRIPEPFLGSAVDVTDTLDLAWLSAKSVFQDQATPDHAIQIATLMLQAAGRLAGSGSRLSPPPGTGTDANPGWKPGVATAPLAEPSSHPRSGSSQATPTKIASGQVRITDLPEEAAAEALQLLNQVEATLGIRQTRHHAAAPPIGS